MSKGFIFYIICFLSIGLSYGIGHSNIVLELQNGDISILRYEGSNDIVRNVDGKKNILEPYETNLEYHDNFPSYSTFYQLKDGVDISVDYTVNDSHVENDIFINEFTKDKITDNYYPENNLIISEPMVFRDIVVKQITFFPYRLDLVNNSIQIYDDVNIEVEEIANTDNREYDQAKISRTFEPLYKDLIINYETSSRDEDYQKPAVLYICGGSSLDNSYVQDLIDWRHRSGFVVYAVSASEAGGSASNIKNYIQNLYNNSDNPPEIVGLIGDTGGSYSIDYFTESWSGYYGAGDMPYSLLEGDDLLPEVFVGRISVNSSGELSNVINKTLAYEKATYLEQVSDDWYERGALCGDPSSSGWSTVITNEYVGNILNSYGFEDVNANYGNGNYSSWMQNQLGDGCLYMNYRGYYGSSGFGSNNINSANNGYKTPFAVFITCGTGDFNGTSLSEQLFRAGSVSNPKGAVAAIGTATTGTHT